MKIGNRKIGIDVGGNHLSAAVICDDSGRSILKTRTGLDSHDSEYNIVEALSRSIKALDTGENKVESVGIAFPGP